ncbi:dihydrofolate reductase family protein [Chloroflexi bacterium TSY]|nr:dihydrofolate reductase family protein [Chloroflexi bacterium TSY]
MPDLSTLVADLAQQAIHHHQQMGYPFVTLSYAQSLDGSIAAVPGQPTTLSSHESLQLTHSLRAVHDVILVGIGTILADNPRLNVRLATGKNPRPVVVDSQLRLPPDARLFQVHKTVWVATAQPDPRRLAKFSENDARFLPLSDESGRVDLHALLKQLGKEGICSIMVEGGSQILTSFLTQKLADYVVVTIAPTFLGGMPCICSPSQKQPSDSQSFPRLDDIVYTQVGTDMVVWGRAK